MILHFLAGYAGIGLALGIVLLAVGSGWVPGVSAAVTFTRADGSPRPAGLVLAFLALAVLLWPLPLVLLVLGSRDTDDGPPGPPAMGGT